MQLTVCSAITQEGKHTLVGCPSAVMGSSVHGAIEWQEKNRAHSHSIVAGGLLLMSYTTRFTPFTWLMIVLEIRASTS